MRVFKNRYGTIEVALSSSSPRRGDKSSKKHQRRVSKTNKEMDQRGRVKYEWPERSPDNAVRYIKIQQMESSSGGGDHFRGLEVQAVKVYGVRCP